MNTYSQSNVFVFPGSKFAGAPRAFAAFFCDYCGIVATDRPSHYARKRRHFCGQECYAKFRQERMPAHEQPTWKGGIAKATQTGRGGRRYKEWQQAVFNRDGRRCIWCGSTEQLEADHIKRWSQYPELRYDVTNGRTLCQPCHNTTRGTRKTNPDLIESPDKIFFPPQGSVSLHEDEDNELYDSAKDPTIEKPEEETMPF